SNQTSRFLKQSVFTKAISLFETSKTTCISKKSKHISYPITMEAVHHFRNSKMNSNDVAIIIRIIFQRLK
ncbi:hypothetical protein QVM49_33245, partial [Pseudomonas aeruginosa]|uniref:hypothetical protein n=1 Tax=Pseudomonas aeruginosa TaxID=287 RepID=UPI00352551E3